MDVIENITVVHLLTLTDMNVVQPLNDNITNYIKCSEPQSNHQKLNLSSSQPHRDSCERTL